MVMGEAKRRKQKLGSLYGQPLGLTSEARKHLIQHHKAQLLSTHFLACGYTDYLNHPTNPQFRPSTHPHSPHHDLREIFDHLIQHWRNTFNQHYPLSALKTAVSSILQDQPIFFTDFNSLLGARIMNPIIALPEARKYFRRLVNSSQIHLSTHYILLQDVLTVMATESSFPLLQQLFLNEFNDAMSDATEEQPPWLTPHLHPSGWIDLTDEVLFQGANRALAGVLTLLLTLPWEMQLKTLVPQHPTSPTPHD